MRHLLLAALLATIGARPAAATAPSPLPMPSRVSLSVGESRTFVIPCEVEKLAAGLKPYDIKVLGPTVLRLTGLTQGSSTLVLWCADGTRQSYVIDVLRPSR